VKSRAVCVEEFALSKTKGFLFIKKKEKERKKNEKRKMQAHLCTGARLVKHLQV
jgi:hypothetical protein